MKTPDGRWFAIQVQPLKERVVATMLDGKGYEQFLPLRKATIQGGKSYPLFPGYLFCRFDPQVWKAPVVTTPGVLRIVGVGRSPEAVPDWEINNLRNLTKTQGCWQVESQLQCGSHVRVIRGSFSGIEGVFAGTRGKGRVVVQVTMLGGGASIEVDDNMVTLLEVAGDKTSSPLSGYQVKAFPASDRSIHY